jgi:hypothetical protein
MPDCCLCHKHEGHSLSFKINIPLSKGDKVKYGWSEIETIFICTKCAQDGKAVRDHLKLIIDKIQVTNGIAQKINVGVVNEKHIRRKSV